MKKIVKLSESDLTKLIQKVIKETHEEHTDRYMFFSNLEQIHRQTGILLEQDKVTLHNILENGHDWAQDHIATAKESIDQVFDFLMNETQEHTDVEMDMGHDDYATNCEDLKIRVESQNTQIIELNKRVSDLNTSILQNQSECTNRLINKEKEIYDIISEMENELQKNNKPRNNYRLISQETDSIPTRTIETNETPNNKKVLKMIKKVKSKLCQETSK